MTETVPLHALPQSQAASIAAARLAQTSGRQPPLAARTGRRGANTPHCQHFPPNSAHPSECSDAHADKTAAETLLKMQMALRRAVPVVNCPHPFFPVGLSCAYTQARPDGTGPWSAGPWAKGTGSAPAWMPCWQWQPCPVAEFWMTDTPPTTSHSERLSLCVRGHCKAMAPHWCAGLAHESRRMVIAQQVPWGLRHPVGKPALHTEADGMGAVEPQSGELGPGLRVARLQG